MDYGWEIWGSNSRKGMGDMEVIHLKFLKSMLGVRKQTTSAAVYADTGRVPLKIEWEVRSVKYWEWIRGLPHTHILYKGYQKLLVLDKPGQTNWSSNVRRIVCSMGTRYQRLWETQDIKSDPKALKNLSLGFYTDSS